MTKKQGEVVIPSVPFGNVFWFTCLMAFEDVVIDPFENFIKQSCRNRYEILNHQGRHHLSIPVEGQKGEKVPVMDILIKEEWASHHWKNLFSCYNSSPFFLYYQDAVEELLSQDYRTLHEFNLASINLIIDELELDVRFSVSKEYVENGLDVRSKFKPCIGDFKNESYNQVFIDRLKFEHNLSILDLLFNLGPETALYLEKQTDLLREYFAKI